jgi:hypothetical protein
MDVLDATSEPRWPRGELLERCCAFAILLSVLSVVTVVAVHALQVVGFNPQDDEGTYRHFVMRLDSRGLLSYPSLFREFNADPERWMSPWPSRVGYVLIAWLAAQVSGATFATLTYVSFASHLLTVAVNFLCARKRIGDLSAALFASALACSPLLLRLGVQPLSDSTALAAASLAIWWFFDLVEDPTRARLVRFVAAFTFALMVKETSMLLAPCFAVCASYMRSRSGTRIRAADLFAALSLPGVLCVASWMLAAWSVRAPFQTARTALASLAHNPYVAEHYNGPWFSYGLDFLLLSPLPTLLALAATGVIALDPRRSPTSTAWWLFAATLLLETSVLGKNVRYVAVLELPLRWLALDALARAVDRFAGGRRWLLAIAVIAMASVDLRDATGCFATLYDPVTRELLRMRGL